MNTTSIVGNATLSIELERSVFACVTILISSFVIPLYLFVQISGADVTAIILPTFYLVIFYTSGKILFPFLFTGL
jgi:hypothetical protein